MRVPEKLSRKPSIPIKSFMHWHGAMQAKKQSGNEENYVPYPARNPYPISKKKLSPGKFYLKKG